MNENRELENVVRNIGDAITSVADAAAKASRLQVEPGTLDYIVDTLVTDALVKLLDAKTTLVTVIESKK